MCAGPAVESAPTDGTGRPKLTAKHIKEVVDRWKEADEPYCEERPADDEQDDATYAPATEVPQSRGVGVLQAHEAINCLKRIPCNDGLRRRAGEIVLDWIHHNIPEAQGQR